MADVLITGGAGYIGSALVKALLIENKLDRVIVYDNLSKGRLQAIGHLIKFFKDKLVVIKGDIRDKEDLIKVFKEYNIKTVVHLASIVDAFSTNRPGKDLECEYVNYKSTIELAKIAKKFGVKNFIYQSSVSVYSKGENIKEDSKKSPLTAYGRNKLKGEGISKLDDKDFNVIILRCATVFGYSPGFRYETVLNYFTILAFYGLILPVYREALKARKSYLEIEDNVNAILFCLRNINRVKGQIFNIVSLSCNLDDILKVLKKHFKIKINLMGTPNITQQPYTVSGEKFYSIGFRPKGRDLEKSIKKFKRYLERDYVHLTRNYILTKELISKRLGI